MVNTENTFIASPQILFTEQMRVASAPIGADDLIPILVRVVSFAKPKHLISDLRYIQRFHYHGHMKGQMAYSFTNILAVASFVEDVKIDETNGESIYNLVSRSSTNLKSSPRPQAHEPVPESPSALMRPLTEFNAMATTVFNKVTFVPRAITSAVADTFRSRSKSSTLEDHQQLGSASPAALPLPSDGEWCERTRQVHPATGELIPSDEVINSFRRKVVRLGSYDEMVVKDIPVMFADYKRLLMTYHFEPRPQAPPK